MVMHAVDVARADGVSAAQVDEVPAADEAMHEAIPGPLSIPIWRRPAGAGIAAAAGQAGRPMATTFEALATGRSYRAHALALLSQGDRADPAAPAMQTVGQQVSRAGGWSVVRP